MSLISLKPSSNRPPSALVLFQRNLHAQTIDLTINKFGVLLI